MKISLFCLIKYIVGLIGIPILWLTGSALVRHYLEPIVFDNGDVTLLKFIVSIISIIFPIGLAFSPLLIIKCLNKNRKSNSCK